MQSAPWAPHHANWREGAWSQSLGGVQFGCFGTGGLKVASATLVVLFRGLKLTICDPFADRPIVELVGVALVVVAAPQLLYIVQRAPESLGLHTMGGFSWKMGAFSEGGTLPRSSQRLSGCTRLKKSCSSKWFTTNLSLVVTTRSIGSLLKGPMGSASTTSSASPIMGGVGPKGKRITPCPETMLGVVTPYHSRSHSFVGQRECMGSLVSGSSVETRRVLWVRGKGNETFSLPRTRSDPYLLDTNHEGVVGLVHSPPTAQFLHLRHGP